MYFVAKVNLELPMPSSLLASAVPGHGILLLSSWLYNPSIMASLVNRVASSRLAVG